MNRILVTGAKGFLGKSVSEYFTNKGHTVYALTRQELDVSNKNKVIEWFSNNKVDIVIHTAIKGGRRGQPDTFSNFTENTAMFENLLDQRRNFSLMINFGSGAEFDRKNNICNFRESRVLDAMPEDFYGLAKNLIARRIIRYNTNIYNFRLFGCFGKDETENRLIKTLIHGIKNQSPISIDACKEMDFFYDQDVCRAIEFYMNNHKIQNLPKDINLVYEKKMNLREIYTMVEKNLGIDVQNVALNKTKVNSYTGCCETCKKTFPSELFVGFEEGLHQVCKVN